MHVYDEYVTMDRKILFVGQETHSWGKMGEGSVEFLQAKYRDFNLGKSADYETRSLFAICEARSGISTGPCFTAVTTLTHR